MVPPFSTQQPFNEIIIRIREDLDTLVAATSVVPPSTVLRRQLDSTVRELMRQMEIFLQDLDPVQQPHFIFDPGNPAIVGRFIALAMIAQHRVPLMNVSSFYGSGVYAIYYTGNFSAYAPIRGTETPIYVGKADPTTNTAKTPIEQGEKLSGRLKDHRRNILKAEDTLKIDDFEYRSLVVQSGWQAAAESYLIHLFHPVWNNETDICYGLGKHGDAPGTRANLRSPWDTLHPGRDWAHRDPNMKDARPPLQILADLARHFSMTTIYNSLEDVMRSFMGELRQL